MSAQLQALSLPRQAGLFPAAQVPPWGGREPRKWQQEALPLALASIKARERGIISATPGAGKSVLIGEICASGRGRVLVTVPTIALVDQLGATLEARCPGQVGRYYTHAKDAGARITVCCLPSVPDLLDDPRWPGPPALWVADEVHKTQSSTILEAYDKLQPQRAIGFTGTPFRADEKEELSLWDKEIYYYGAQDALRDGVIVPFRVLGWDGAEVPLDQAALALIRQALPAGPGLVNAVSIADAEQYRDLLQAAGMPAGVVHSKLPRARVAETLEALRQGQLQAVVHVNMLSEGVDLPWLRWLCMRRPVGSRVRFCQEVGRVLRASPGKTEALLLDPLDLLGNFSLSYEAVLAGMAPEPDEPEGLAEAELREAQEELGLGQDEADKPERLVRRLETWRRYLRTLYLASVNAGLIECRVKSTRWRPLDPTEKQKDYVGKLLGGLSRDTGIPLPHRKLLGVIGEHVDALNRGDVSDLLSLSVAFKDLRSKGVKAWGALNQGLGFKDS